ncbi:cation transporter, partial [Jeotgalibaca porci]
MKCEGCSNTVSKLFMAIQGVERVLVDRDTKLATVEAD